MDKDEEGSTVESSGTKENNSTKTKPKNRGKKRKRSTSESSSDYEDVLPDNALQVEKSITTSAIKNNLDEIGVRKILKKVVTNDHVLALVKLREEEEREMCPKENTLQPKLTRAKVKELMKVSPKSAWNLELTPIKHIPVKTRPEVKALIAQELPEDEDDEEYEPTHDDVPSDDDQGLESCSDLDSQPRTPATPRSQHTESPRVVHDGPFKVPQDISTPSRRKLDLDEEATIALRTRSKLSLSSTSIEHIESTFIPPDDIPMPDVDDLWNQFLNECLNPASTSRNEDDDETDPEYNVAADPDANDEDEEALGNGIIKISKKELNDLVTELFNIMPEAGTDDDLMTDNLANSVLTDNSQTEVTRWEGKQEPVSEDEDTTKRRSLSDRITFEKSRVSVGKTEPPDIEEEVIQETREVYKPPTPQFKIRPGSKKFLNNQKERSKSPIVRVSLQEQEAAKAALNSKAMLSRAPPLLQKHLKPTVPYTCEYVHIQVESTHAMLPEQIKILQQQLRQHIQLSASNFLQLYIHPIHWSYAPQYKEFLTTFMKLGESNPKSVVNVCNLKPAVDLITTWEKTLSVNSPENSAIVKFIQNEVDRSIRRGNNKSVYLGEFHETFLKVVANSPVFLYPYLLPPTPYRGDNPRKYSYLRSEDELLTLGLDQFSEYVRNNPQIYKLDTRGQRQGVGPLSFGLKFTIQLINKHMLPWMSYKMIASHVHNIRKTGDTDNPIYRFFKKREVTPVKHTLLPYNPQLTLYEHPEEEVPRIFVRYLAKTSQRFRSYLRQRKEKAGRAPTGVPIQIGQLVTDPSKTAQPPAFIDTSQKQKNITDDENVTFDHQTTQQNNQQTSQTPQIVTNLFKFVETSTGSYLVPLTPLTTTIDSNTGPITSHIATPSNVIANNLPEKSQTVKEIPKNTEHCTCCILLRKICKVRQTTISEFFGSKKPDRCYCKRIKYPKVTNKLKLLIDNYKSGFICPSEILKHKLALLENKGSDRLLDRDYNLEDLAFVTKFHLKLVTRSAITTKHYLKNRIHTLLSKFDLQTSDPLKLAAEFSKAFGSDLVDVYKDFLPFLTPEQADKVVAYKDYFVRTCLTDVVKKIEEEVKDEASKRAMFVELSQVFTKTLSTACEICTGLLNTMHGYPKLAEYVHSMFPHRKEKREEQPIKVPADRVEEFRSPRKSIETSVPSAGNEPSEPEKIVTSSPQKSVEEEQLLEESAMCASALHEAESTIEYEADESMSEEEIISAINSDTENDAEDDQMSIVKEEHPLPEYDQGGSYTTSTPKPMVTINKTEIQDLSECSNSSMKIVFEEEIKSETPEWKREEDKLILEVLKENLSPEERVDKTILEIIEEKDILNMLAENLVEKSKEDIQTRLLYLLQLC